MQRSKPRKIVAGRNWKIDKKCLEGRRLSDLDNNAYLADLPTVEMDSVVGPRGSYSKCLLTLHFTSCNLMLAFIRDRNDAKSVENIFNYLMDTLGIVSCY